MSEQPMVRGLHADAYLNGLQRATGNMPQGIEYGRRRENFVNK